MVSVGVFVTDNKQYPPLTIIYLVPSRLLFGTFHCRSPSRAQRPTSPWTFVVCSPLTAHFPLHAAAPEYSPSCPSTHSVFLQLSPHPCPRRGPHRSHGHSPLGGVPAWPSWAGPSHSALREFAGEPCGVLGHASAAAALPCAAGCALSQASSACRPRGRRHLLVPGRNSGSRLRKDRA